MRVSRLFLPGMLLFALLSVSPLRADDVATKTSISEFIHTVMPAEFVAGDLTAALVRELKSHGVTDETDLADVRKKTFPIYLKAARDSIMQDALIEFLGEHLTEDDIVQLRAFQQTPIGTKFFVCLQKRQHVSTIDFAEGERDALRRFESTIAVRKLGRLFARAEIFLREPGRKVSEKYGPEIKPIIMPLVEKVRAAQTFDWSKLGTR